MARRAAAVGLWWIVCSASCAPLHEIEGGAATVQVGPILGALTDTSAIIVCEVDWRQPAESISLRVREEGGSDARTWTAAPSGTGQSQALRFEVSGLRPATGYRYEIGGNAAVGGEFRTQPPPGTPRRTTIAIGSCADESEATGRLWQRIAGEHPDAVVLLGDTPYIDSTDLATQLRRHREFLATPHLQELLADVPLYSVWDDHDFGLNDTNGLLPGKEHSLEAFRRFRPNPSFGDGEQGVYCSFREGPVECFLLDTRWFAATGLAAEGEKPEPTLLGDGQWEWLEERLAASTAPFKLICSSMVFNSSVRALKPDYWGRYPAEYGRLMRMIGRLGVTGVLLVSGDVHNTRVVHHPVAADAGYDLVELVSSPMHDRIHDASMFAPDPRVELTFGRPHSILMLEGDDTGPAPTLRARFMDSSGAVFFERLFTPGARADSATPAAVPAEGDPLGAALDAAWDAREELLPAIRQARGVADSASLRAMESLLEACRDERDFRAAAEAQFAVRGATQAEFTAYASPELPGSTEPTAAFATPLLLRPSGLARDEVGPPRALIESGSEQAACAWVPAGLHAYLAQLNGSVRVWLGDGRRVCLVQDGTNGRPYTSLAATLREQGTLAQGATGLEAIREAFRRDPEAVRRAMLANERYTFFREVPCEEWPPSALGTPLRARLALAVDPAAHPLGSVMAYDLPGPRGRLSGLAIACDVGGAIRGAARADLYLGAGETVLAEAGEVHADGFLAALVASGK